MAGIEVLKMLDENEVEKTVEVAIGTFPQRHERMLRNYFGGSIVDPERLTFGSDLRVGQIEDYVLTHTVKSVSVDGEKIKIDPQRNFMDQLPTLYDPENWDSLAERLVRLAVKHNIRLSKHPRYRQIFAFYLPDNDEADDPLEKKMESSVDTSTNTSSSTSQAAGMSLVAADTIEHS